MKSKLIPFVLGTLAIVAILLGIAYFSTQQKEGEKEGENTLAPFEGATTTPNYTIEVVPTIDIKSIQPNLDRSIQFSASIPADARVIIEKKVADIVTRLKADPMRADDWFSLAVWYHTANDYEGARDVWLFLLKVTKAPDNAVVYDNLGKLYKFSLKDFPKSESYFKQSIAANPKSITPYIELFELYRDLYKTNTTAAIDILTTASVKFPDNVDPWVLLGQYYRDRGETQKARDAFTKALNLARATNDVARVEAIGAELERLPQ